MALRVFSCVCVYVCMYAHVNVPEKFVIVDLMHVLPSEKKL